MLHFLKFSSLETIIQIVYGQITKIGDRMKDRKLAITFKVLICPDFHWSQSMEKCSRIRSRLVSASRSIEITWFGPVLYTNLVKIEFLAKFMVFHIFFVSKQPTEHYQWDPSTRFDLFLIFLKSVFPREFSLHMTVLFNLFGPTTLDLIPVLSLASG